MATTKIEWADESSNPIVVDGGGWWCQWASEGCDRCYSEVLNQNRFYGGNGLPYRGQPPTLKLKRELLAKWAKMSKPRRHFVGSMTDLFGAWIEREWQFEILDAMRKAPKQTFMILTKRPHIMRDAIAKWLELRSLEQLPSNIQVGTTVEMQKYLLSRTKELLQIPAKVRFLSVEPLLEAIHLKLEMVATPCPECAGTMSIPVEGGGVACPNCLDSPTGQGWILGIHQIIIGGESGHNARKFELEWGRSLIIDCQCYGIAPFFKQAGSNPWDNNQPIKFSGKGGNKEELPPSLNIREFPE